MKWPFGNNSSTDSSTIPWAELTDVTMLNDIIDRSKDKTQVVFKHSTRCGRSAGAMHRLESAWDINAEDVDIWYLDLLAHRDISNKIAEEFNVPHQSPQILVVNNGEVTFTNSHESISVDSIKANL